MLSQVESYGVTGDRDGTLAAEPLCVITQAAPMPDPEVIPPDHFFQDRQAIHHLRHYLPLGMREVRIAVGFFTVRGYSYIRSYLQAPRVAILVGMEEQTKEKVRAAIINDVLRDLRTGLNEHNRTAAQDLVDRLARGLLRIIDARALRHHAKLYIIDAQVVLAGSFNLTGYGLREQIEQGSVIRDAEAIAKYTREFEQYFAQGEDITKALLEALRRWLELASPWHAYLKTLLTLESLHETEQQKRRAKYQQPTAFQRPVVANVLRQLADYRGAYVVMSTGLGKTTIGTDVALRLREKGHISNVLILAPTAVADKWHQYCQRAGLSCSIFTDDAFDRKPTGANRGRIWQAEQALAELDAHWLVIVDEAHELRNRFTQGTDDDGGEAVVERRIFEKLLPAIERSGCYVLLLTGTPYATKISDINSQLQLLPHRAPARVPGLLPGFADLFAEDPKWKADKSWKIGAIEEVRDLDVASVLTLPAVWKYFSRTDANGHRFVDFNGTPFYVPDVLPRRVEVPLLFEEAVATMLSTGYFRVVAYSKKWSGTARRRGAAGGQVEIPPHLLPEYAEGGTPKQTLIERQIRTAWASSPRALRDVLQNLYNNGSTAHMDSTLEQRREAIEPVLALLNALTPASDAKFQQLLAVMRDYRSKGEQIIIFSERRATVVYLAQALAQTWPKLRVAALVRERAAGLNRGEETGPPGASKPRGRRDPYQLLPTTEAGALIAEFAPRANNKPGPPHYDVLITTDAYGIGVDMQDARVIIHYDLAQTPIEVTQRAGRILRFRPEYAVAELISFFPIQRPDLAYNEHSSGVDARGKLLMERATKAQTLTLLPMFAEGAEATVDMGALLAQNRDAVDALLEEAHQSSDVFQHAGVLAQHRDVAARLPDGLVSAKAYEGETPLVFVLVRHQREIGLALYDVAKQRLKTNREGSILALIASTPETPLPPVRPVDIDQAADACVNAWCERRGWPVEEVERVVTVYLHPPDLPGTNPFIQASVAEE